MTKRAKLKDSGLFDIDNLKIGGGLAGRFIIPPFSILRTNEGTWKNRKKQWLNLGIESEIGRSNDLLSTNTRKNGGKWKSGDAVWLNNGTSIFDPVLCEVIYSWFSNKGYTVIDPFAGGSVRGIVASIMDLKYIGCELSGKQIQANILQSKQILKGRNSPIWLQGDSFDKLDEIKEGDLIFSCPPYGDLEVYSDDVRDLSTMQYKQFKRKYTLIINKSISKLKENRFAVFVVANFRDKQTGFYNNLVGDTVKAFEKAGAYLYNDVILATSIGSLPVRTTRAFNASRKMGKAHQNVLIFYKGSPKMIKENYKEKKV